LIYYIIHMFQLRLYHICADNSIQKQPAKRIGRIDLLYVDYVLVRNESFKKGKVRAVRLVGEEG